MAGKPSTKQGLCNRMRTAPTREVSLRSIYGLASRAIFFLLFSPSWVLPTGKNGVDACVLQLDVSPGNASCYSCIGLQTVRNIHQQQKIDIHSRKQLW